MSAFTGYEIVIGVSGGIAAYWLHARGAIPGPRRLGQPEAKPRFASAAAAAVVAAGGPRP
jgi:hypothetical protein